MIKFDRSISLMDKFRFINFPKLWTSLLVIYPILFMFQGLDFTDQGYWLVGYQRIFSDPQSVESMMSTWLSLVLGGLIDNAGFGVISFRIAFIVVIWISTWITYKLLKDFFKSEEILFPLFVTLVYITKWGVNWISYNDLSALFYLAASFALWRGMRLNNIRWVFLAGLILGAGVYLRIPNLVGLALATTILFAGYIYKWAFKNTFKYIIFFFFGFGFGLLAIFFIISILGHQHFFLNSLYVLKNQAGQAEYHHSSAMLMNMLFHDHMKAFKCAIIFVVILLLVDFVKRNKFLIKIYQKSASPIIVTFGYIIISIALAFYLEHGMRYSYAIPGICYAVLTLGIVQDYKAEKRLHTLIYFIALILLFILPLGSGNGIGNAIYGSWLALPLVLLILKGQVNLLVLTRKLSVPREKSTTKILHTYDDLNAQPLAWLRTSGLSMVLMLAILSFSIYLAYMPYRDSTKRLSLRYNVNSPLLSGILTSKARSNVINELLDQLKGIVKPGDQLLALTDMPILHYLTQTRPYLSSSWTRIIDKEQFAFELINVPKNGMALPVMVRSKGSVSNSEWPTLHIDSGYFVENESAIQKFIITFGYRKYWENQWFEIWTPI